MLAEGEFVREARRVLPRLATPGAHIRAVEGGFGVFVARNRYRRAVTVISGRVMDGFLSRDLLKRTPSTGDGGRPTAEPVYLLGEAGKAYLRRLWSPADNPYAAQHRRMTVKPVFPDGKAMRPMTVNEGESPIGWLRRRKGPGGRPFISDAAYDAAERLREDFTLARLMPKVTTDWTFTPGTAPRRRDGEAALAVNDAALAARRRVQDALTAAGPGLADALLQVCCHLRGLEEAERTLNWPRRSGKLVLSIALERLALHYGFVRSGE